MKRAARRALIALAVVYLCALVMLTSLQRKLLFPAPPYEPVPAGRGALIDVRSPARFVAHHAPARGGATVVYFHGNGDQLAGAVSLGELFTAEGHGFYAVEYPGYGPFREGAPSEDAILAAAEASLVHLRDALHVPTARTVLIGQSLGSGVATEMARRGFGAKLVLLSPFLSIPDVAARHFPWLPVRALLRDRFDSASRAPSVAQPTLVLHGTADDLIPMSQGEALARRFPRGRFVAVRGAGHNDLWGRYAAQVLASIDAFVGE